MPCLFEPLDDLLRLNHLQSKTASTAKAAARGIQFFGGAQYQDGYQVSHKLRVCFQRLFPSSPAAVVRKALEDFAILPSEEQSHNQAYYHRKTAAPAIRAIPIS
jgi:hypothetical protein